MNVRHNVQIICKCNNIAWKCRPHAVTESCIACFVAHCLLSLSFFTLFCKSSFIYQPYVVPQCDIWHSIYKYLFYMFVACVHDTEQLARHEQCVGGSLMLVHHSAVKEAVEAWRAVRRCSLMKGCTLAEQHKRRSEWLAHGLCLAPSLCRRDWRHHAGSRLAREVKVAEEKVLPLLANLLRFRPTHTEDSCLFYWSTEITKLSVSVF